MTTRIVIDGDTAMCFTPYRLREIVKSFPGRKWDATLRAWLVPVVLADELADALRHAGETVFVTGTGGARWQSGRTDHGHRDTPGATWAHRLLDAVGDDRAERVFKALAHVLHPDVAGGDTQLMQQLNEARDRVMSG
jgi:hypothetical protein